MYTLTFKGPDGTEHVAHVDGEVSVGREEGNDVVLPDSAVSRRHCRFFLDRSGALVVEDHGSSNGVTVDGARIDAPTPISERSEVYVGEWQVEVAPGRGARPTPRRPGSDGPTGGKPAARPPPRGNGAEVSRATRALPAGSGRAKPAVAGEGTRTRRMNAAEAPLKRAALARPDAARSAAPTRAQLEAVTGPWAGKLFALNKPVTVIGRVAGAEIVIDDDSVSRRHLEIRKSATGYVVRDLGSANGTFVNGEAITEAPLANGDEVRAGVVGFVYTGPGAARPRGLFAGMPKKKRLLILGGAGGALLLIIVVAIAGGGSGAPPPPAEGPGLTAGEPTEDVTSLLSLCKLYTDKEATELNYERGIETCGRVLKIDPLNVEATQLHKRAKREAEQEKLYKEAKKLVELGREEEAIDKFVLIETTSSFYRRARNGFQQCAEIVSKRAKTDCLSYGQKGINYCKAAQWCAKHLDFNCHGRDFRDDFARFEQYNRLCGTRVAWTCPPQFARFYDKEVEVSDREKMMGLLTAKYRHPKVIEALMVHALEGKPRRAYEALERFKATAEGQQMERDIDELRSNLAIVDGRYTSGAPYVQLNPDKAAQFFQEALDADTKIMPGAEKSPLARQMSVDLARSYFNAGADRYKEGRLEQAAETLQKGWKYNPANTDLIELINKVEQEADRYMMQGCPGLEKARKLLRSNQTLKLREIDERWQKMGCR